MRPSVCHPIICNYLRFGTPIARCQEARSSSLPPEVDFMHNRDRTIAVEGVLALVAFALMLGAAARALQPHPDPSPREQAITLQEPQTPPSPQQPDAPPPGSKADKTAVFTGTIVRHGSDFVLRVQSG